MIRITIIFSAIKGKMYIGFIKSVAGGINRVSVNRLKFAILVFIVSLSAILFFPFSAFSATNFFIDPDWTGKKSGTQSEPWSSLDSAAWSVINSALASGDVTVFFSAREATYDSDENYGGGVELTKKTPSPPYWLTLNGSAMYNSNDTAPAWLSYKGTSKAVVRHFNSQNGSHIKYNNVKIQGFRIEKSDGGKAVAICGDNWVLMDSDIYHTSGASEGPLVLIVPTADSAHEGSSSYCQASHNITIRRNTIHDGFGELLYVGGGGLNAGEAGSGCPSHSNLTIENNEFYRGGIFGGQGDAMDLKACLTNITIRGNRIHDIGDVDTRAIVSQGQIPGGPDQNLIIEKNHIYASPGLTDDAAIAIVDSWGVPRDVTIRNNVIVGNPAVGIKVYGTQSTGVRIYNNTVANNGSVGIVVLAGTLDIQNNALYSNNSGGDQAYLSGSLISAYNAYNGTWRGTCSNCLSGLTASDFFDPASRIFTLSDNSRLISRGTPLASFSDDFGCVNRPSGDGWDIGAYEWSIHTKSPCPPSQIRVVK